MRKRSFISTYFDFMAISFTAILIKLIAMRLLI